MNIKAKQKSWYWSYAPERKININRVQLKSRISRQWFIQNVF